MRKHSLRSERLISAGEIVAADRAYAVTPEWFKLENLLSSVQAVGIRVPLQLEQGQNSGLRIISGFRRFMVSQELGIREMPCTIAPESDSRKTFVGVLRENLGFRSLTEVEKAIVLAKLKFQFNFEDSQLVKEFLPLLGLRADRYHLEQALRVARLPEHLQRSMTSGSLSTDIALELSAWSQKDQELFVGLVDRYKLGRNKQKGLFELLGDLQKIQAKKACVVWEESGAKEFDEDSQFSPQDRLARIKTALRLLRYPRLSQYERRYRALRTALRLPSGVKVSAPPYFEGSRITITIEAESSSRLRKRLKETRSVLDGEELDQMFELL